MSQVFPLLLFNRLLFGGNVDIGGVQAFLPGKEEGGGNGKQTNWKVTEESSIMTLRFSQLCPVLPLPWARSAGRDGNYRLAKPNYRSKQRKLSSSAYNMRFLPPTQMSFFLKLVKERLSRSGRE